MIGRRIYIITGARTMSGIGALALRCLFHTLYAIDMGYVPVIDLKHYPNQYYKDKRVYKDNVWEYYFEQPFNLSLEDICDEDDVVISDNAFCPQTGILNKHPLFYPKDILSIRALKIKNRMNKYLKFNGETKRFANERCERILKGNKNVLGVLLRGTDYTLKQSYDEFIQPKTDKVIGDVKKFLKEKGYEKIYLATEDINIYQAFKNEFKDLLLENPQYMYSTNYDKRKFLSEIKVERENHNYMLGLEYLASLYILSKCRGFIGGLAGGTRIAYIMSEKWDDFYVYDLGQYGKYNSIAERIFSVKNLETTVNSHRVFTIFGIKIKINKNSKPKWYVKLKRLEAVFNYRRRYDKGKIKGVVYSCMTGDYDDVPEASHIDSNMDYILFTDNKKLIKKGKKGIWKIRPLEFDKLDDTKNARWHKVHPHLLFPEYTRSIWIDSNIEILTDKLFKKIENNEFKRFLVPIHDKRRCIFDECEAVLSFGKDIFENVDKIQKFLYENGMPRNYGLLETNILYRHHNNPEIIKIMEQWWDLIEKYSKRDQLSFTYVLWKNGIQVKDISMENARTDKENFLLKKHNK